MLGLFFACFLSRSLVVVSRSIFGIGFGSVGKGCVCRWYSRLVWFTMSNWGTVPRILVCMSRMKGKANYFVDAVDAVVAVAMAVKEERLTIFVNVSACVLP